MCQAMSRAGGTVLLLLQISKVVWCLQCYECSDFPREPGSQDESLGACPGWLRPAKYYGLTTLYDGCMTVKLANNGTVLAQNAVIYAQCLQYQKNVPSSLKLQGLQVRIRCCTQPKCNAPKKYRWDHDHRVCQKLTSKILRNTMQLQSYWNPQFFEHFSDTFFMCFIDTPCA